MSDRTKPLSTCSCCQSGPLEAEIYNAPGQPALAYRLGRHPTFLRRMLARLSNQTVPPNDPNGQRPLARLGTRSSDDPAIALLDAWATTMDVLAFYQERIANEGFLRTATERRSILELAREIGYELNPGVAASVDLAFAVEEASGAPKSAIVTAGSRVQSVPGPGEKPQSFETSAELLARVEWNHMCPRRTRPQELAFIEHETQLYLLGRSATFPSGTSGLVTISSGDFGSVFLLDGTAPLDPSEGDLSALPVEQIYLEGTAAQIKAGDRLLFVGKRNDGDIDGLSLPVQRVVPEPELDRTRVDLVDQPKTPAFAPPNLSLATASLSSAAFNQTQVSSLILGKSWKESDLSAFTKIQGWSTAKLLHNVAALLAAKPGPAEEGVFAFRQQLGFFGHNAPRWDSLPKWIAADHPDGAADPYANDWEGLDIWTNSQGVDHTDPDVYLERSLPEVVDNSWAVFTAPGCDWVYRITGVREESIADYSLSAKVTGLSLLDASGFGLTRWSDFKVRKATAHVQGEKQVLAQLPITEPLQAGDKSLMLDRLVLGLQAGQRVLLTGERSDAPGVIQSEGLTLTELVHTGGFTTLNFEDGLAYGYVRDTVTVSANVALATHGETVYQEVLGSGNGAQPNQRFRLKRPPLTYVSAATPSGGQSTLAVRVNGLLWEEAPSLYGLGPNDQKYIVRNDDDGSATVIFGDGKQGARLPTGRENVVATYRSGIGLAGEVAEDTLTTMQSKPLGIRSVANPLPAAGAEDPENMDDARQNAPLTVLTMDRIVSRRDFEDFARTFAGIGKARAVELWHGESTMVHITVASASGKPVDDQLMANLVSAINEVRDPVCQVRVDSYQPLFCNLKAKILVDDRYPVDEVLGDVEAALLEGFGFNRRNFGQPVTAAEVVSVAQSVDGVTAVDLDQLYLVSDPSGPSQMTPPAVLPASLATWPMGGELQLAQLLLINPVGIYLDKIGA